MTSIESTQVVIVGAGPTGLSLACQLARFGIDFQVIELNDGLTPYSKAIGVHARTLEIYEQMGLANDAVTEGTIARKGRLVVGGKIRGELNLSTIGAGFSPYPFVLMLEQSKNERLLYDHLDSLQDRVHFGTRLEGLEQNADGVTASARNATGDAVKITSQYLVGCDGARSPVRHFLGLDFEGSTFERTFYVADAEVNWEFAHDALMICLTKETFVVFFPLKGVNRYRIVGVFPESFRGEAEDVLYQQIEARIKDETQLPMDITNVEWFSTYKVHTRHTSSFAKGRCFLAGDSAHIHSPAGAQGMNTGIQDAYNLAWKLAYVLRGTAAPGLLDSYDQERLANAKHLLQTTDRMFELAAGSGRLNSFLRLNVVPRIAGKLLDLNSVKEFVFPLLSQIGIHYRDSVLSDHEDDNSFHVKAGDRMPWFNVDGHSVYDNLRSPCFHWLVFGSTSTTPVSESSTHSIPANIADMCDVHTFDLSEAAKEHFGSSERFNVLLRPDNYVAFIGSGVDDSRLRSYFASYLEARFTHPGRSD